MSRYTPAEIAQRLREWWTSKAGAEVRPSQRGGYFAVDAMVGAAFPELHGEELREVVEAVEHSFLDLAHDGTLAPDDVLQGSERNVKRFDPGREMWIKRESLPAFRRALPELVHAGLVEIVTVNGQARYLACNHTTDDARHRKWREAMQAILERHK